MTNQNEVANTQAQETEIVEAHIVRENDQFVVVQDADGKFKRKAKYALYTSFKAETRADKIFLANLLEGAEESGSGLKDHVGKQIEVQDIITRPYDKINEETGELEYGVLTYLITPEKQAFVTSSKSVYFSITRIMELFGKPTDEDWENITVKVLKERGTNGDMIKIKLVG
jgi:hypothetical protein